MRRFRKLKPEPGPTFDQAMAVMAVAAPTSATLLALCSFAGCKSGPEAFRAALSGLGFTGRAALLADTEKVLEFFTAGTSDLLKFRKRIEEEMANG